MVVSAPPALDLLLRVRGTVQGVGFRPFVHRLALRHGVQGWVRNDAEGVLVRAAGDATAVEAFVAALAADAPPAARVERVERASPDAATPPAGDRFVVAPSADVGGPAATAVPADLALCPDCRRELLDPADRRHRYPFINCTQCGPRYSLIERLPYDRARTTMRTFALCPDCSRDYGDPADRRHHAEPVACPACGPRLTLVAADGTPLGTGEKALTATVAALHAGGIVAVKGLGGYHLMADARNEGAVTELRRRKHREEKPLAVMFPDLATARTEVELSPAAAALLASPAAPIVLASRRDGSALAPALAPGNPWIGVLLPYTPLHLLLLQAAGRPLVATSANLSEEPLCTDNAEAKVRLAGIADLFLEHDRPIARPVDDSVVRHTRHGRALLLRRARGFAPAPLALPGRPEGVTLCVGAHLKSTVALAAGDRAIVSPHLGDLGNAATQALFERTVAMLSELHGLQPTHVAHDKHPDYASTLFARRTGLPAVGVQHHLAHVLACLLDNRAEPDGVLGVSWDGTGAGEDGTVWGGEFILLRDGRATRFARLRPFRLPGGEAAVRDIRRLALALGHETGCFAEAAARFQVSATEQAVLRRMLDQGLNSPLCTSAGRLFDAAGALLGVCTANRFEGQAPLQLEAAAGREPLAGEALPFPVRPCADGAAVLEIDWEPAFRRLLTEQRPTASAAAAFHRGLAAAIRAVAEATDAQRVALTGGCFQNALLHDLAEDALGTSGFTVLAHRELSPNDNSISAGQAYAARLGLTTVHRPS
jgi:hydrogenase maturation protein HypF